MIRPPTRFTRVDTRAPYTTVIRSSEAAGASRAYRRQQRLGHQHRAEQICREHLLQRVVGELLDAADAGDAGVVHQHVRCADRVEDRLAGGGHRGEIEEVELDADQPRVALARADLGADFFQAGRSEEHTSELQSLMRISYAALLLKKQQKVTSSKHTYHM